MGPPRHEAYDVQPAPGASRDRREESRVVPEGRAGIRDLHAQWTRLSAAPSFPAGCGRCPAAAVPRQVIEPPAVARPCGIVAVALEGRPRQVSRSLGPDPDVPALARHMVEGDAAAVGRDSRAVIAPALLEQDAHLALTAHPHQVALGARDVRNGPVLRDGELGEPDPAHQDVARDLHVRAGHASRPRIEWRRGHHVVGTHVHQVPHRVPDLHDGMYRRGWRPRRCEGPSAAPRRCWPPSSGRAQRRSDHRGESARSCVVGKTSESRPSAPCR